MYGFYLVVIIMGIVMLGLFFGFFRVIICFRLTIGYFIMVMLGNAKVIYFLYFYNSAYIPYS